MLPVNYICVNIVVVSMGYQHFQRFNVFPPVILMNDMANKFTFAGWLIIAARAG